MPRDKMCLSTHQRERVIENVIAFKESKRKVWKQINGCPMFDMDNHFIISWFRIVFIIAFLELGHKIVIAIK